MAKSAVPSFKEASILPKGGAVAMDYHGVQAQAAVVIGNRFGLRPEAVYNWAVKFNIDLSKDVMGKVKLDQITEAVLNNKPL